jgi:hypothetical protein
MKQRVALRSKRRPEQRSGDGERGMDRSWWTVDGGFASPERERVARERESLMRERWESKFRKVKR